MDKRFRILAVDDEYVNMPIMDGYELLHELKKDFGWNTAAGMREILQI